MSEPIDRGARIARARKRAARARAGLTGVGLLLFGGVMVLARLHFPGHAKGDVSPLAPPSRLVQVVRENQLQAGILAPAEAPPGIGSAPS